MGVACCTPLSLGDTGSSMSIGSDLPMPTLAGLGDVLAVLQFSAAHPRALCGGGQDYSSGGDALGVLRTVAVQASLYSPQRASQGMWGVISQ